MTIIQPQTILFKYIDRFLTVFEHMLAVYQVHLKKMPLEKPKALISSKKVYEFFVSEVDDVLLIKSFFVLSL